MNMKFSGNILANPLNQYDEESLREVKEVGEKLITQAQVNNIMKNNSYSEDILCFNSFNLSIYRLNNLLFSWKSTGFFSEYFPSEFEDIELYSQEDIDNYVLILYAFLAILSEEEIQEFRSWYL